MFSRRNLCYHAAFEQNPRFVELLRKGDDLVQGCRLPTGGGEVLTGAMPFLHSWLENLLFYPNALSTSWYS